MEYNKPHGRFKRVILIGLCIKYSRILKPLRGCECNVLLLEVHGEHWPAVAHSQSTASAFWARVSPEAFEIFDQNLLAWQVFSWQPNIIGGFGNRTGSDDSPTREAFHWWKVTAIQLWKSFCESCDQNDKGVDLLGIIHSNRHSSRFPWTCKAGKKSTQSSEI